MSLIKVKTRGTDNVSGRRNLVHNGSMSIAQRGTSQTGVGASSHFVCDRWKLHGTSSGRLTATQDSSAPLGFGSSLKLDCTTADTSIAADEFLLISQGFEGQNLQSIGKGLTGAKQITVSFYVKASGVFTFGFELYDADNARSNCRTFATTTDWVRHSFVIQADEDDGSSPFDNDNAASMYLNFFLHAGSNYTSGTLATNWANYVQANRAVGISSFYSSTDNEFFLTGVQIEVGDSASDFEHRSFGEELELCKRYFIMHSNLGTNTALSDGFMWDTTEVDFMYTFPVEMRATPSIYQVTGANYFKIIGGGATTYVDGNWTLQYASKFATSHYATSDGSRTAGDSCHITFNNTAARLGYSAEL